MDALIARIKERVADQGVSFGVGGHAWRLRSGAG